MKIRPGCCGEGRQQLELGRRQVDGRPPTSVRIRGTSSSTSPARIISAGLERSVGSAQHGPDAGDELARAERLGQVVVGTELEAEQLVELVVARREHDDRDRRVAAQLAGDVEAVEPGQAEVEHDEVGSIAPRGIDSARGRRSR